MFSQSTQLCTVVYFILCHPTGASYLYSDAWPNNYIHLHCIIMLYICMQPQISRDTWWEGLMVAAQCWGCDSGAGLVTPISKIAIKDLIKKQLLLILLAVIWASPILIQTLISLRTSLKSWSFRWGHHVCLEHSVCWPAESTAELGSSARGRPNWWRAGTYVRRFTRSNHLIVKFEMDKLIFMCNRDATYMYVHECINVLM